MSQTETTRNAAEKPRELTVSGTAQFIREMKAAGDTGAGPYSVDDRSTRQRASPAPHATHTSYTHKLSVTESVASPPLLLLLLLLLGLSSLLQRKELGHNRTSQCHTPSDGAAWDVSLERRGRKEVVAWARNFAVCTSCIYASRCRSLLSAFGLTQLPDSIPRRWCKMGFCGWGFNLMERVLVLGSFHFALGAFSFGKAALSLTGSQIRSFPAFKIALKTRLYKQRHCK